MTFLDILSMFFRGITIISFLGFKENIEKNNFK